MAGTLVEIHDGLRDALAGIDGLLVADHIPEKIVAPMAVIQFDRVDFPRSMAGGSSEWRMTVTVLVRRMEVVTAQRLLDEFLSWDGPWSIRAAVAADRTLGGACHSLLVESVENVRPVETDDGAFLAADFAVRIHA